ncbi:NAD-dependent succinate-semialdehyde dehydrogenase [Oryzicola mucosus]|uniref:NAD-dependent succinate-semialdehyde dehydrogenase n=1 Tax=Oryzicola mucosus TaxID=2767425 RepID=A0A8J6PMN6_9HYPH|nr:NAD-dependent succinate-semialdehyde dehydrogenase [Oryzicola mucosus]
MIPPLEHLIAGEWTRGSGDDTLAVINPATEEEVARLPLAAIADLDRALESAERGFQIWRAVLPPERSKVLRKFAGLLRQNTEQIAAVITAEQGKPLAEARNEVAATAELTEWLAEESRRIYGRLVPSRFENTRILVTHEPVGPVAAFSPWNFPCMMAARKIAHALAAGCSVILKPSEETPGTAVLLGRLVMEAGAPKDVVNIVFGDPAQVSDYLIDSPIIKMVNLTGSVPVGKHVAQRAARQLKKATLELGGHSPAIVMADADIDRVVDLCWKARYRNAGQVCTAPTRFFVQSAVMDRFVEKFTAGAASLNVGPGTDAGTTMGPVANRRRLEAMESFVADAGARGGTVLTGGQRLGNRGMFFAPTVLSGVPADADVMRLEPFGPIAPIAAFDDIDAVVAESNALPYGLAAYAFTKSHTVAAHLSSALKAGVVAVNGVTVTAPEAPFGGVGDSGLGREAGIEGVLEHMNVKTILETFG